MFEKRRVMVDIYLYLSVLVLRAYQRYLSHLQRGMG